jgi:ACT domain-containing protein
MMMIADGIKAKKSFDALAADLNQIGAELGLKIGCQKAEIFEKMHRI